MDEISLSFANTLLRKEYFLCRIGFAPVSEHTCLYVCRSLPRLYFIPLIYFSVIVHVPYSLANHILITLEMR